MLECIYVCPARAKFAHIFTRQGQNFAWESHSPVVEKDNITYTNSSSTSTLHFQELTAVQMSRSQTIKPVWERDCTVKKWYDHGRSSRSGSDAPARCLLSVAYIAKARQTSGGLTMETREIAMVNTLSPN